MTKFFAAPILSRISANQIACFLDTIYINLHEKSWENFNEVLESSWKITELIMLKMNQHKILWTSKVFKGSAKRQKTALASTVAGFLTWYRICKNMFPTCHLREIKKKIINAFIYSPFISQLYLLLLPYLNKLNLWVKLLWENF